MRSLHPFGKLLVVAGGCVSRPHAAGVRPVRIRRHRTRAERQRYHTDQQLFAKISHHRSFAEFIHR